MDDVNVCHQVAVSYNVIDADNKAGVLVTIGTKDKGNGITEITVCGKYVLFLIVNQYKSQ